MLTHLENTHFSGSAVPVGLCPALDKTVNEQVCWFPFQTQSKVSHRRDRKVLDFRTALSNQHRNHETLWGGRHRLSLWACAEALRLSWGRGREWKNPKYHFGFLPTKLFWPYLDIYKPGPTVWQASSEKTEWVTSKLEERKMGNKLQRGKMAKKNHGKQNMHVHFYLSFSFSPSPSLTQIQTQ